MEKELKSERLTTQLTPSEKVAAELIAEALDVPVSHLLRERSLAQVVALYERFRERVA